MLKDRASGAVVAIGRLFEAALGFAAIKIVAAILPPSEYSRLIIFQTLVQGAIWLFLSPVQNYILAKSGELQSDKTIGAALGFFVRLDLLVSLLTSIIYFGYGLVLGAAPLPLLLWGTGIFASSIFVGILFQLYLPLLNMLGKSTFYSALSASAALIGLLLAIVFVRLLGWGYLGWQSGTLFAQAFGSGVALIALRLQFREQMGIGATSGPLDKGKLYKASLPLYASIPFQWFNLQGYRITLSGYGSADTLGQFFFGFSLGGKFLSVADKMATAVHQPMLYSQVDQDARRRSGLLFIKRMAVALGGTSLILVLFSGAILGGFAGDLYRDAAAYYLVGVAFDLLRCINNSLVVFHMAADGGRVLLFANALSSALVLGGIMLLRTLGLDRLGYVALVLVGGALAALLVNAVGVYRAIREGRQPTV